MKASLSLLSLLAGLPTLLANPGPSVPIAGAAYFISNQLDGNYVISSEIGFDGKLTVKSATSAGGLGSAVILPAGPQPDPLSSQASVAVSGNFLYTVNAGSNTLAAFAINPKDPTQLQLIGKPVNTGGEFPTSVAVSKKTGLICVLNGGKVNGVNCFKQNPKNLVPAPNTLRLLNLNVTTPPFPGNQTAFGQVMFNPSETQLIVTVQAVFVPSVHGYLAVWDVSPFTGALSTTSKEIDVTGPAGPAIVPFGMVNIPGQNAVLASDPAFGYDIFDLSGRNRSARFTIPNQKATCWAVTSPKTNTIFLVDANGANVIEVSVDKNLGSSIVQQYPLGNTSFPIDATIVSVKGKEYLYVNDPGQNAILVFFVPAPGKATLVQKLALGAPLKQLRVTAG
ncbi:hypothetical protein M422DRAFT_777926, partial [Sphaerobolus stellatus SS14]